MSKRYTILEGRTVKDTVTSLEWQQDCAGPMCWEDAKHYAATLELDGHKDWRVPTYHELVGLVDISRCTPSINIEAFPDTPSCRFWTSSSYAGGSSDAWYVYFYGGDVYYYGKPYSSYVRCVRGGLKEAKCKK